MDMPRKLISSTPSSFLRSQDADITIASFPEALGDDEIAYVFVPLSTWMLSAHKRAAVRFERTELPTANA